MKIILLVAIALAAQGCAVLPNSISPEFEHISHATQHAPFASNPTKYGVNVANVTAEWDLGKHFYVTLAEGVSLDRKYQINGHDEYGALMGPREVFTGRVGYKFIVKQQQ